MKKKRIFSQTIRIGKINCELRVRDKHVHEGIARLFDDFQSAEAADIIVELDIVKKLTEDAVTAATATGMAIQDGENTVGIFRTGPGGPASVVLTMPKSHLEKKTGYKIMNLVIPRAYYTVTHIRHDVTSMVVHSSAVRRESGVFLFCGPSETGKTTVARSCRPENGLVLNDEMNLLEVSSSPDAAPVCCGLPVVGGIPEKHNLCAPLACIINLKQSQNTVCRPIDKADAYLRLMRQIIAPKDFFPEEDDVSTILKRNSVFAEHVIGAVPCYEMEFTLDRELFWEEIGRLEAELAVKPDRLPAFPQN